jgi:PAS domain S-box-containing protein
MKQRLLDCWRMHRCDSASRCDSEHISLYAYWSSTHRGAASAAMSLLFDSTLFGELTVPARREHRVRKDVTSSELAITHSPTQPRTARDQEPGAEILASLGIPIWLLDLSGCEALGRRHYSGVKSKGREQLRAEFLSRLTVAWVNAAAVRFHRARSEADLLRRLDQVFLDETIEWVVQALDTMTGEQDVAVGALDGSTRFVRARFDAITTGSTSSLIALTILPHARRASLLRAIPDMVFELDENGVYVDFAGPTEDALVAPADFIGKSITETLPPDVAHRTLAALQRLRTRGAPEHLEYALAMSDGLHWYQARLTPLPNHGACAHVRDVTEQKAAAWRLQESEHRFRIMADCAPMMVWMTDRHGDWAFFNKTWLDFTGLTFDQERAHGWQRTVHPDDVQRYRSLLDERLTTHQPFQIDFRLRRRDGEYRWLRNQAVPRGSTDLKFEGFIGSCMDITELRSVPMPTQV